MSEQVELTTAKQEIEALEHQLLERDKQLHEQQERKDETAG